MSRAIKDILIEMRLNDLPDGREAFAQGQELGKDVEVGVSLFMEKFGVSSEREYKEKKIAAREVMFMFQYGLTDYEK